MTDVSKSTILSRMDQNSALPRSRHAAEVTSDPPAIPSDITVRLFSNNTVVKVLC